MSVMFLKQLKLHLDQLESRMQRSAGKVLDQELAQARQFLSATKDPKWRNQIIKRIKKLEESAKSSLNLKDVEHRHGLVKELYDVVKSHPDYNRTRKRRAK